MAEPDVSSFCKDFTDKLGQLPAVFLPEGAPDFMTSAAETLGPQIVDAVLRKQGCMFVEPFVLNEEQMPQNLKIGLMLEIGADSDKTMKAIEGLLNASPAPVEKGQFESGEKYIKVAVPPNGPFSHVGIMTKADYLVVASGFDVLKQMNDRITTGKTADWLTSLQSGSSYDRVTAVGMIDLAYLRNKLLPLAGDQVIKGMRAFGLGNLRSLEFSGGYAEADFAQRFSLQFDGQPTGIFDVFGDEGLSVKDISHFPEDSFLALATALDGDKMLRRFQQILIQMDPSAAQDMASGLIEFQSQTGIDIRQVIENFEPAMAIHNGFGDGILSGAMLKAKLKDPTAFENTLKEIMQLAQASPLEFELGMESFSQNGKTINSMRFGGLPVPVEPSWFVSGKDLTVALFPSVLSSATNSNLVEPLIDSDAFQAYLPLMNDQDYDSEVVGFSYSDTKRSYEVLYGYVCVLSAMGKNTISGSLSRRMGAPLNDQQMARLAELFGDLQIPSCRSIVKHLTPQVGVVVKEKDAIVFESHSSLMSSNLTLVVPGIAVGMLLPAVQSVRAAARRTQSANNLRQMALAALNYESAFRHYPSGDGPVKKGGPAVSWRVKILPYIEQNNLYELYNFDEPWDSESNRKLLEKMPEVFKNPASSVADGFTIYRGVGGKGGIMGVNAAGESVGTSLGSVIDGTSNTILFLETSDDMAVPWTKPDGGVDPDNIKPWQIVGNHVGGFNACRADGSTVFIAETVDDEVFKNLLKMNDGNVITGDY